MNKTSVYTLVNGNIKELAHRKQQKSQKVILPASHWLCGNQGQSKVKLNDTIRLAIPENHTLEPKITTLSYTQPKLW